MRTADPRRRAEFTAAWACARTALARLGLPAVPVLAGRAGEPRWPAGETGSITHCTGYRACAVARITDLAGLGIDAEPNAWLPAGLIESVACLAGAGLDRPAGSGRSRAAPGPAAVQRQGGGGQALVPVDRVLAGPGQLAVFADPACTTGSITHCAGYRACAVARTADVAALGIDAEPDAGLPAGLLESVAGSGERAWIARQAAAGPRCAGTGCCSAPRRPWAIWYPLTGRWPGPGQLAVFPDPGRACSTSRWPDPA